MIIPPYIHNLAQLSIRCGLYEQMSQEQQHALAILMPMNIEARYPEYKEQLLSQLTEGFCRKLIDDTK